MLREDGDVVVDWSLLVRGFCAGEERKKRGTWDAEWEVKGTGGRAGRLVLGEWGRKRRYEMFVNQRAEGVGTREVAQCVTLVTWTCPGADTTGQE